MLTDKEKQFVEYWSKNRDKENQLMRQIGYGLPKGLLFSLPILLAVVFHDWYKNMIPVSVGQLITISIAVLAIAVFYSVFQMKFRWDINEQLYKELKFKEKKENESVL